ncbi:MAG: hypothetical protein KGJ13_06605 [Patescibacteria group bacterium]|nr:hypothetical protein [Patescibacteria group bacterium]
MFDQNEGRISNRGEMAAPRAASSLDIIAELQARQKSLEEMFTHLHGIVDKAVNQQGLDPELIEHVQHVMRKHFHHDRPEPEAEAPKVPKFDPYTGAPLN